MIEPMIGPKTEPFVVYSNHSLVGAVQIIFVGTEKDVAFDRLTAWLSRNYSGFIVVDYNPDITQPQPHENPVEKPAEKP